MFLYAKNLTEQSLHSGLDPWDFKLTETLTAQIRGDKQSRQDWYKNVATQHFFYTLIEPANPNIRPSKNNPPRLLHGFAVDYDAKIPEKTLDVSIESYPIKPTWVERSIGNNVRLVWVFEAPLRVDSFEFCSEILTAARKWLQLDLLPGLDEPAFLDPTRLLCNGCNWRKVGGTVPPNALQAFYVECAKKFNYRPASGTQIPLDVVEKEIFNKFPGLTWSGEFVVGSSGPSFWIPGSVSSNSAIVKSDGMFTFSAHAEKPFYSWSDILGAEFVKQFATDSIANATKDIWYDGKSFWKQDKGLYLPNSKDAIMVHLECNCRLSGKPGKDGISPIKNALNYLLHGPGRIVGAAPFVFSRPGPLRYQNQTKLNISTVKVLQPCDHPVAWKDMKWISEFYDKHFFEGDDQKHHWLAWLKHFYESGYYYKPYPGQNAFFLGSTGIGKTFNSHAIVGTLVGGVATASKFLTGGTSFNSDLLEAPLWTSDDETFGETISTQNFFSASLKAAAANQVHRYERKFEVACTVEWMGRIICTSNLDFVSQKILSTLDNSSLDKTHLFLCKKQPDFVFPDRYTLGEILSRELPLLARFLLDYTPPPECVRDSRYGYAAYHHPSLLDRAHQCSKAAPFKELLVEALIAYFNEHPEALEWRGAETSLVRLLHWNPANERITRTLRLEQVARYLEMIQKEGILKCDTETGEMKTRIWVFKRKDFKTATPPPKPPELPPTTGKSIFEK